MTPWSYVTAHTELDQVDRGAAQLLEAPRDCIDAHGHPRPTATYAGGPVALRHATSRACLGPQLPFFDPVQPLAHCLVGGQRDLSVGKCIETRPYTTSVVWRRSRALTTFKDRLMDGSVVDHPLTPLSYFSVEDSRTAQKNLRNKQPNHRTLHCYMLQLSICSPVQQGL